MKRGSSGSTFSSTTSTSRCCLRFAPLLVWARSFFSEGCPGTASWDAGADGCFSDLFCDILASPLITRFCLASSSDLRSRRFLKDATSFRRASALRFASRSCCCKKEICCCSNAIISSFFILQRYEKKTRLPKITSSILSKIVLIINNLQARSHLCSVSCDILLISTIFRSVWRTGSCRVLRMPSCQY